ncbi:cytochrome B [Hydrogenophaga crassostreae]|uniref:Cytochrome B n=1 Tax=Hydrogenophaga crassostreae TaxID=1763535 RepID=A0A162T191_9BURK|nr:cytochrome b/b6 domain-containing protein [Hydrogenophaga crassostreae]AOW11814.1 cytochrome B [Hydrogenophaga crassostreae]OAD42338.1 cytochrome B [Hydrogenophaga crassostreae]
MYATRIWDLPTRLFHWALAICVVGLVVTANIGGNAMNWHFRFGYSVLTLLLFRISWGFVGGRWSRFVSFVYSPASLLRHLRGESPATFTAGHSPTGALSVFAMLLVLLAQVGSGLFADDDIAFAGPLSALVSGDTVSLATGYHKEVGKVILIVLVALHLLAIAYYKWVRKEDLVRPMFAGDKVLSTPVEPSKDTAATRLLALGLLLLCAYGVNRLIEFGASSGF